MTSENDCRIGDTVEIQEDPTLVASTSGGWSRELSTRRADLGGDVMVQMQTCLDVADNSGAKRVQCIKVLGGTRRRYATVGDIITVSVKEACRTPRCEGRRREGRRRSHGQRGVAQRRELHQVRHATPPCSSTRRASRSGHASSGLWLVSFELDEFMKIISLAPEVL